MKTQYIVVVQASYTACFSYLGVDGLVGWERDAKLFDSIAEANQAIAERGWLNTTRKNRFKTTAYVAADFLLRVVR
jgi:hypothetical protein